MANLVYQWWTRCTLASVGGGVVWEPIQEHMLGEAVSSRVLFRWDGFGEKYIKGPCQMYAEAPLGLSLS